MAALIINELHVILGRFFNAKQSKNNGINLFLRSFRVFDFKKMLHNSLIISIPIFF